ncbi:MAG: hypothetical protein KDK78_10365 [Chlamydiia bacterium]|nr:hypothetical protein [Chlamydiia bacterium]
MGRSIFRILVLLAFMGASIPAALIGEGSGQKRDYWAKLTQEDKRNIRFIVESLGRKSLVSLLFSQSKLHKAGDAIAHVHPLSFLAYVCENQELYRDFQNIHGRPWREFSEGFEESLRKAAERGNLGEDILKDFSKRAELPIKDVMSLVEKKGWSRLMERIAGR